MLTLSYVSAKHAKEAKLEFNGMFPDYSVEILPPSKTVGK